MLPHLNNSAEILQQFNTSTFLPYTTSPKPGPWKWNGTPVPAAEMIFYGNPDKVDDKAGLFTTYHMIHIVCSWVMLQTTKCIKRKEFEDDARMSYVPYTLSFLLLTCFHSTCIVSTKVITKWLSYLC